MAHRSPILDLHQRAGAVFRTYGPDRSDIIVPEAFEDGGVAVEYAALRKHAGVMDLPQRGTLEISGSAPDRLSFLGRMVTQELKGLAPFSTRRALWLNRKGRIDADLRLIEVGESPAAPARMFIDLDAFAVERAASTLGAFLFAEDIRITDRTAELHRLAIHGPAACAVVGLASSPVAGPSVLDLQPGQATIVRIAGAETVVDRWDSAGVPGLELTLPIAAAEETWATLLGLAAQREVDTTLTVEGRAVERQATSAGPPRVRAIGWHAYNIARIEAGTALYYLDFGPDSLPHETGAETLADRVSFTKGCYLGQEVVARMQSLGHPKQKLVGIRFDAAVGPDGLPVQPETGTPLYASAEPGAPVVGAVTSSTLSPMLAQASIAFAMVKWANATEGAAVFHHAPAGAVRGVVGPSLRFVPAPAGSR